MKSAPLISAPVITDPVRLAPLRSAYGPTIYAPLASLGTKMYGLGSTAGGCALTIPPDRTNDNRAFVKSAPSKSAPVITDPVKFAPLKSA